MKRLLLLWLAVVYGFHTSAQLNYQYWFDYSQDIRTKTSTSNSWQEQIDVSGLNDGIHTFHVLVEKDSILSPAQTSMFVKIPHAIGGEDIRAICLIDKTPFLQENVSDFSSLIHLDLDVSQLSEGLHQIQIYLETPSRTILHSYATYFYRAILDSDISAARVSYVIDNSESKIAHGTYEDGGLNFMLDVSDLRDGLHHLSYILVKNDGPIGGFHNAFFYKIPLGGNCITRYEYWLNDADSAIHTVNLSDKSNPLQLITMLPVESVPISSKLFHFGFTATGEPIVYAKNEIHLRFWDSYNRFSDITSQYIDENIVDTIIADSLERNTIKKIAIPSDNEIQWFKISVQKGDSMLFRTNLTSSMQLYSPSGKEVYNAQGEASLSLGGCHAWEDGIYYLAVHDIVGKSGFVNVEYRHMDKYTVLSYTPHEVGNRTGGAFRIQLNGNGFRQLTDIRLIHETDTISLDTFLIRQRGEATIQMRIPTDTIANGAYDMILCFDDSVKSDTIRMVNAITLAEPRWENIKISVSTPSAVLRPYPIKIILENDGNVGYTYLPFNIAIGNNSWWQIETMEFDNFGVAIPYDVDTAGYSFIQTTENLLDKGVSGMVMFFYIPYLGAEEKREFALSLTAPNRTTFDLYTWTGDAIEKDAILGPRLSRRSSIPEQRPNILSWGDNAEEITGMPVMPDAVGHAGQLANTSIKLGVTFAGIQNGLGHTVDKRVCEAYGITPDDPLYDEIMNLHPCVSTPGDIPDGDFGDWIDDQLEVQRGCAQGRTPDPGERHSITVQSPCEPNDIIGYESESGSHFMRTEIRKINYTIESENDSIIATAAAHTIIVRDTLDGRYFDLNSFGATEVTIGDDRTLSLNGEQNFVRTIDLRTRLNVIAQVALEYNAQTGIAVWTITSLDPMTLEPTQEADLGALPVNTDGTGVATFSYYIKLKENIVEDGTTIPNRASIIFDYEEPIFTPTWTNTIDAIAPHSQITSIENQQDTATLIRLTGNDNRSGIWKYEIYAKNDTSTQWTILSEIIADTVREFTDYVINGYDATCEYRSLAIDSAGNRELIGYYQILLYCDTLMGQVFGAGNYTAGINVTLSAIPNEGYKFTQWSDGILDNPRIVTADSDIVLYALFEPTITTLLEQTRAEKKAVKVLYDGHLYILKRGRIYTITGQEVR